MGTLVLVLGIVLPVLYVTLIHHGIKLLLTVCLPKLQKTGKTQGFKPGLMSWWEGFWGLWVTFTATVSTLCLCMMFYSGPISCSRIAPTGCSPDGIEQASRFGVFAWLVIASYLYQLHHLVEERLIKVNSKES